MHKQYNFKNILIFGHSNIGDVCYDLVVINPLRNKFPRAKISFITSVKVKDVLELVPGIDEVIVFDKHSVDKGFWGYIKFLNNIRNRKFDLAVILRDTQMHYFFNIPVNLKLKKSLIHRYNSHVAQKYLKLLEDIGISNQQPQFNFRFSKEENQSAENFLKKQSTSEYKLTVGIMPFAGWLLKCWPVKHWNKLIDFLDSELKAKVFVFGKANNSLWSDDFFKRISSKVVLVMDRVSLSQSLAIIKHVDLFISPDTSFLHLASCMGVKSIGLYGATNKDFIYPLFHKDYIVISESKLDCVPCYPGPRPGSCGVKDKPASCMADISVEEVIKKVEQILNIRS